MSNAWPVWYIEDFTVSNQSFGIACPNIWLLSVATPNISYNWYVASSVLESDSEILSEIRSNTFVALPVTAASTALARSSIVLLTFSPCLRTSSASTDCSELSVLPGVNTSRGTRRNVPSPDLSFFSAIYIKRKYIVCELLTPICLNRTPTYKNHQNTKNYKHCNLPYCADMRCNSNIPKFAF